MDKKALFLASIVVGIIFALLFASAPFAEAQESLQRLVAGGTPGEQVPLLGLSLILAFAVGVSMFVTPCFFPVLFMFAPSMKERKPVRRNFALYAAGFLLVSVVIGFVLGLLGTGLQTVFATFSESAKLISTTVFGGLGAIVLVWALGEFGFVRLPDVVSHRVPRLRGGPFVSGVAVGGALGVGCPFPTYHAVMLWAIILADPLVGALLLLTVAVGRLVPMTFIVGAAAKPRSVSSWFGKNFRTLRTANAVALTVLGVFLVVFYALVNLGLV